MKNLCSTHERRSTFIRSAFDLPPTAELVIVANLPPPWVVGLDGNDSFAVVERILDIHVKIFSVVAVLDSPKIVVFFKPPLR